MPQASRSFPTRLLALAFPAVVAGFSLGLLLMGCAENGYSPEPVPVDEGFFIADTNYTLDEFPFDSSDCAEVFPAGSVHSGAQDPDAAASLRLISTACYHVRVRVIDEGLDSTVRSFDSRFAIFNRTEEDKDRGAVGYINWDGKDDAGGPVPEGVYLWRMEFDFGAGNIRKFRTEVMVR